MSAARDTVPSYTKSPSCGTIPTVSDWISTFFPCSLEDLLECFLGLNRALLEMLVGCESFHFFLFLSLIWDLFVNRNSKSIQRQILPFRHSHCSGKIGWYLESQICAYCIVPADMIKTWWCSSITCCHLEEASSFTDVLIFQITSFFLLASPSHCYSAQVSQPPSHSSAKRSAKTNRRRACAFHFKAKKSLITVSVKPLDFRMQNFIPL